MKAIETAGSADPAKVRDTLVDTSAIYEGVTGTYSLDEAGTPPKGAAIISFTSDGKTITTTLVDKTILMTFAIGSGLSAIAALMYSSLLLQVSGSAAILSYWLRH